MKLQIPAKYAPIVLVLSVLLWLSGCMANTGTFTHAALSHFAFVGETQDAIISIDDHQATPEDGKVTTEPGRHRIRVTKGGKLVVDREVLVGDQQTMEISVP
jgi:hypothetical protein